MTEKQVVSVRGEDGNSGSDHRSVKANGATHDVGGDSSALDLVAAADNGAVTVSEVEKNCKDAVSNGTAEEASETATADVVLREGESKCVDSQNCAGSVQSGVVENEIRDVAEELVTDHEEYVVVGASDIQNGVAAEGEIGGDVNVNVNGVEESEIWGDENGVVVTVVEGHVDVNQSDREFEGEDVHNDVVVVDRAEEEMTATTDENGRNDVQGRSESISDKDVDECEESENVVSVDVSDEKKFVTNENHDVEDVVEKNLVLVDVDGVSTTTDAKECEPEDAPKSLEKGQVESLSDIGAGVQNGLAEPESEPEPSVRTEETEIAVEGEPGSKLERSEEELVSELVPVGENLTALNSTDVIGEGDVAPDIAVESKGEPSVKVCEMNIYAVDSVGERAVDVREMRNDAVDSKAKPSNDAVQSESKPSVVSEVKNTAEESEAEPSNGVVQCESEPTVDVCEMENKAVESEANPSNGAVKGEAEPSNGAVESDAEPSNGAAKSEAEPSNRAVQSESEPSVDVCETKNNAVESEAKPSIGAVKSEVEPSNGSVGSEAAPSNVAVGSEAEPSNVAVGSEAEPSNDTVERKAEPSDGAVESEAEPSNGAVESVAEPSNGAVESEAEPSNSAVKSGAEPSNGAVEGEAEPSNGAVESEAEPLNGAVESRAEPSNGAVQSEAEHSNVAMESEAEPSNGAVESEAEPLNGAVESRAEPSNGAVQSEAEHSNVAVESEAEPSNGAVESETEPSNGVVESESEPSVDVCEVKNNVVGSKSEPSVDVSEIKNRAVESEFEPSNGAVESEVEPSNGAVESEAEPSNGVVASESESSVDVCEVNNNVVESKTVPSVDVCEMKNNAVDTEAEPSSVAVHSENESSVVSETKKNVVESEPEPSVDVFDNKTDAVVSEAEPSVEGEGSNQGDEESRSALDALDGQSVGAEVVKKPFYYLIRVPRYDDDENMKEQIKHALQQVEEKTKIRDAIRAESQTLKARCKDCNQEVKAAITAERAARDLLKSKRQEMDSVQSTMNRLNNAISVGDIDGKIRNMEHMIQHETLPLNEEKQLIRQIKQLKQNREELSSNMRKHDQSQQSLDHKDNIEEHFKLLKKEIEVLRNNVLKSDTATKAARKKYSDECHKLDELLARFKAADDIRQEAYAKLHGLKKQLYEKSKNFWEYRNAVNKAQELAAGGKKEELQCFCVDQVERIMELWNKNDGFRRDYVRCNTRSTLRRLQTLDGRSLGPDEEPPVIPNAITERAFKNNSMVSQSTLEQEKKSTLTESVIIKDEPVSKVVVQRTETSQTTKAKKPTKPAPLEKSVARWGDESDEDEKEEPVRTKEEEEMMLKAEKARKEEEEAKLKERRRLEEIEKAKEALERKKRNAEKAQQRAALKAQKEAEQKEKEREKRARKKERRNAAKADTAENTEQESVASPETLTRSMEECDLSEKPAEVTKKVQKPSQFTRQTKAKSVPLALRNRGKRRIQPWMWVIIAVIVVVALFYVGNSSSLRSSLKGFGF